MNTVNNIQDDHNNLNIERYLNLDENHILTNLHPIY